VKSLLWVASIAVAVTGGPLFADESAEDSIWTRDHLFGDWAGLRTDLSDHGIYVDLRLTHILQSVTSGGVDTGSESGGVLDTIINIDAEKLGLWKGLAFNVHVQTRYGEDVSSKTGPLALATTPLLYPLPGEYSGTDVTGAAAYQTFFDGKAQAFAGKLQTFDLVQGLLPQTTHNGVGGFMNVNALATAMPWFRFVNLSQWGGGAWTLENNMPQAGLIVLGQANTTTTWSTKGAFSDGTGALAFYRHSYKLNNKDGYLLGVLGGSTKDFQSLDPINWDVIPGEGLVDSKKKNPKDAALYMYQVLWQGAGKEDVHLLIGGTIADDNPSFSDWSAFASLEAYGVLGSRRFDRMGVSGWYTGFTDDVKDLTAPLGLDVGDIWGMELYYNYQITPSVHAGVDIQFLQSANADDDMATVPGIKLVVDF